jgi:D-glycero-D-manno-heptose 1,7-bisphosphate phosphatase
MTAVAPGAAVFLDRDGVLIRDVNYLSRVEEIEVLTGVAEALRLLRAAGLKLVVVTNQSVVARGKLSEAGLRVIHMALSEKLAAEGAAYDAIYYCPHHPTAGVGAYNIACACRKPNPGMIERAARELGLDAKYSYVVGDQAGDMALAARVGAQGVLIREGTIAEGEIIPGAVPAFGNLLQAARWIVTRARQAA